MVMGGWFQSPACQSQQPPGKRPRGSRDDCGAPVTRRRASNRYTPPNGRVSRAHRERQSLQPPSNRFQHANAGHRHPDLQRECGPRGAVHRLRPVLDGLQDVESQVIYVNDGSTDGSLEIMLDQRARDQRFTVIDLSRNFGQQAAIAAGLAASRGRCHRGHGRRPAGSSRADSRDGRLLARRRRGGPARSGGRARSGACGAGRSLLFHRLFGWLADFPIPADVGVYGLLDRQGARRAEPAAGEEPFPARPARLGRLRSARRLLRPRRRGPRDRRSRASARLLHYALDGVFSFSYKPLRLMVLVGSVICVTGFALAARFVIRRLAGVEQAQMGFTTLVTLVLFLGGVQLVSIGLLGEYLARIYDEVKERPLYIVRRRFLGAIRTAREIRRPRTGLRPMTRRRRTQRRRLRSIGSCRGPARPLLRHGDRLRRRRRA